VYDFDTVETAIDALKRGDFVVVMDDEDRENEGDLVIAAEHMTTEKMAFLVRHTSGIICAPLTEERASHLDLPRMVENNTDPKKTAFTVSCDVEGTSTGVSATDRTLTVRALVDPASKAEQFRKPGHVFPLVARAGGVLERRGHTEATVDLCQFASLQPVGVLAELANKDGTMCRLKECHALARKHGLPIITVDALVAYKKTLTNSQQSHYVELLAECEIPIQRQEKYLGVWKMRCYRSYPDGLSRHVVLIKGDIAAAKGPVLARIHSECFTSHVIGSKKCDCSQQMDVALDIINNEGCGVAIYVDGHEGRGIGLHNKIKAYSLQDMKQLDTYAANKELGFPIDMRNYETPRAILQHLGISQIAMISNNPIKVKAFDDIVARVVPILCDANEHNASYLKAKRIYEKEHIVGSPKMQLAAKHTHTCSTPEITAHDSTAPSELNNDITNASNKYSTDPHLSKEIPIHLPSLENISTLKIGIIRTSWNETLVGSLHSKCIKALLAYGIREENIVQDFDVPGSFELPYAAQSLASSGRVDAVVCFGVLIKGETMHFEYISGAVSQGLMQAQLTTGIPVIYGVLNCLTLEQAAVRCGTTGDSVLPQSLAATAIRMASLKKGQNVNHTQTKPMLQPCAMG
jgi:3,4-dihydroxy 2-butanone 4-phosphate synthase/GTP cyclohydrolase II